jgi:hypothetical protein
MAPAPQAGAGWVHVRPLRQPRPPGGNKPTGAPTWQPSQPAGAFLAPDHRPPLARVKLVRPRQRPAGRPRLRALQLDPGRAPARTRQLRAKHQHRHHPTRRPEATGLDQYALLTAGTPMGVLEPQAARRSPAPRATARMRCHRNARVPGKPRDHPLRRSLNGRETSRSPCLGGIRAVDVGVTARGGYVLVTE